MGTEVRALPAALAVTHFLDRLDDGRLCKLICQHQPEEDGYGELHLPPGGKSVEQHHLQGTLSATTVAETQSSGG